MCKDRLQMGSIGGFCCGFAGTDGSDRFFVVMVGSTLMFWYS